MGCVQRVVMPGPNGPQLHTGPLAGVHGTGLALQGGTLWGWTLSASKGWMRIPFQAGEQLLLPWYLMLPGPWGKKQPVPHGLT